MATHDTDQPHADTSVRVFIVADDEGSSDIDTVLRAARDIEVIGHSRDVDTVQSEIKRAGANVAVIDVRNHEDGVELCREIRDRVDGVVCLVVSGLSGDEAKVDAILCGADGDLDLAAADVHDRLREAHGGASSVRAFLREARSRDPEGAEDPLGQLTYRERSVVRHIVEGRTNREIGEELGLAEKTVRNYVSNVLNKLDLENRTQLAVHLARSLDRVGE